MDRLSPDAIPAIERDLTAHLIREFALDVRRVLFDATNFFTFIDTFNERCTLAQRGKSKEGRAALRIVGLALLVSTDFHVPLGHHTYPGNRPDSSTFASLTDELVQRHRLLVSQGEDITLVFDKGTNALERQQDGLPVLRYRCEDAAWQRLQRERLGKAILFTDREDWTDAQLIRGYRSQHQVEAAFRDLKNPQHLALRPQHHWTDQKIRVHVFCCVLALTLCSLLRRELHRRGIERALPRVLEGLGGIREVAVAYPAAGANSPPRVQVTLTPS